VAALGAAQVALSAHEVWANKARRRYGGMAARILGAIVLGESCRQGTRGACWAADERKARRGLDKGARARAGEARPEKTRARHAACTLGPPCAGTGWLHCCCASSLGVMGGGGLQAPTGNAELGYDGLEGGPSKAARGGQKQRAALLFPLRLKRRLDRPTRACVFPSRRSSRPLLSSVPSQPSPLSPPPHSHRAAHRAGVALHPAPGAVVGAVALRAAARHGARQCHFRRDAGQQPRVVGI
jgi:hypothetical protein